MQTYVLLCRLIMQNYKNLYQFQKINMANISPSDDAKVDDVEFIDATSSSSYKKPKIQENEKNDSLSLDEQGAKAELEYNELLLLKIKDLKSENAQLGKALFLIRADHSDCETKCNEQKEDIENLHNIVLLQDKQRAYIQEVHEIDLKKLALYKKLHFMKKKTEEYVPQ